MLQKRRLGRTGNYSSVAIMGAAAFSKLTQSEVDKAIELCISHGVNHIDVAPSYGDAEKLIGPWLEKHRKEVFLGCKTEKRGETDAHDSLYRSLERLRIERFDLLQLHAVTSMPDLDKAMDGALKALIRAKEEGLTKWIGITGHGIESPAIYLEALRRFDFDTVMFPVNPVIWSYPDYRRNAEELLAVAERAILALWRSRRRAVAPGKVNAATAHGTNPGTMLTISGRVFTSRSHSGLSLASALLATCACYPCSSMLSRATRQWIPSNRSALSAPTLRQRQPSSGYSKSYAFSKAS